jgi:hypothetical protein
VTFVGLREALEEWEELVVPVRGPTVTVSGLKLRHGSVSEGLEVAFGVGAANGNHDSYNFLKMPQSCKLVL